MHGSKEQFTHFCVVSKRALCCQYELFHINKHDIPVGWCNCKLCAFFSLSSSWWKRWRINKRHGIRQTMLKVRIRKAKRKTTLGKLKKRRRFWPSGFLVHCKLVPFEASIFRNSFFCQQYSMVYANEFSVSMTLKNRTFLIQWHKINEMKSNETIHSFNRYENAWSGGRTHRIPNMTCLSIRDLTIPEDIQHAF